MSDPTERKPPGLEYTDLGNPAFAGDTRKLLEAEVFAEYKKMLDGMPADERALAIKKLADIKAEHRLRQAHTQETQTLPKIEAPSQTLVDTPELPITPLSIMDESKWSHWHTMVFSEEKYMQFAGAFGAELALTWSELSQNSRLRAYQLERVKSLFQDTLFEMYINLYPDYTPDQLRRNIDIWLEARWKDVLASAQKLAG